MNKKCLSIAISIFVIFASIFYLFPNFLLTLELRLCDTFSRSAKNINRSSPHLNEIVIIALDDISFKKLQKKWPFSRAIFADLVNRINKGLPKLIVFDMVFLGEGEDKEGDRLFARALYGKYNILLPYYIGRLGENNKPKEDFISDFGSAGYINKPIDNDGSIRRFCPFKLSLKSKFSDYACELYVFSRYYDYELGNIKLKNRDKQVVLNQLEIKDKDMFGKYDFSLRSDKTMWINYQATMGDFDTISMFRVLLDDFNPEVFKDKVVFIGKTSEIFHDIHDTPLGRMPGTAIVANTALMFLDGRFINEAPGWLNWLVIFIFCLSMVFICYRLPILKGLLFTVAVTTIVAAVTFF
ncbi:CHASE2 domain-containing protein, partial [bacterium]|nr:CHASE2 domain-containing protein [bacterium]